MTFVTRDIVNKAFRLVASVKNRTMEHEDQVCQVCAILIQEYPNVEETMIEALVESSFEAYERGWFDGK